ncbi:hypothetical protein ABQE93_01875 [Mycolicibacterium sp. XJ662]
MNTQLNAFVRRGAVVATSLTLSVSVLLGAAGVASADPYDDYDGGSYSYSEPDYSYSAPDPAPVYEPEPVYEAPEPEPVYEEAPVYEVAPEPEPVYEAPEPVYDAPDVDPGLEDMSGFDLGDELPAEDDVTAPTVDAGDVPDADLTEAVPTSAVDPEPATSTEVTEFTETVQSWSATSSVSQWNSQWVGYDRYYRPIITNPYRAPLQLMYTYGNAPRIVTVPPLQRVALTASTPGVYNFTAVTRSDSGAPVKVSIGSFSGGGYVPAPGQPAPQKPPQLQTLHNVLVRIKYTNEASQPFRVKQLTDLGNDPQVGARKVLLDEETPAWGQWAKAPNGERMFVITKSQELPGITAPAESPLPGYDVALVNTEAGPASSWTTVAVVAAAGCGALGLAAIALFLFLNRRRTAE